MKTTGDFGLALGFHGIGKEQIVEALRNGLKPSALSVRYISSGVLCLKLSSLPDMAMKIPIFCLGRSDMIAL